MLYKFVLNQQINLKKDIEYLENLASKVYTYLYDMRIHKVSIHFSKEEISNELSKLSKEEKAYVQNVVLNAFEKSEIKISKNEKQI